MDYLNPEQFYAVRHLETNLASLVARDNGSLTSSIWDHNSFSMFYGDIRTGNLPSEKDWKWNQAKARRQISLPATGYSFEVFKINPRRKSKTPPTTSIPGYKMWVFKTIQNGGFTILWCEKGKPINKHKLSYIVN